MITEHPVNKSEALPKNLWGFIWHFMQKQWIWLLLAQLCFFSWSLDHTLWPVVLMLLIDGITNYAADKADMWHILATPIILGLSLWIIVEFLSKTGGILVARIMPKMEANIRMSMYEYVMRHSHHYFSNHMAGSIANKISDMTQAVTRLLILVMTLFLPVAMAVLISTVFFGLISPLFAFILVGWIVIHLLICVYFSKKCDHLSNVHSEARSLLSGKIVDALSNNSNVRLFSRNRFEFSYLHKFQKDEATKHWESLFYIEKMKIALGIACFLCIGLGLNWYMLYSWQQGYLTTGEVVFVFNTSWNITMMAWIAGLELPTLYKEIGICKQALSIIRAPHDIVDMPQSKSIDVSKGEIVFENVTFKYQKNAAPLFQDMNVTIKAGQKVGLVGFSGSGKSTFVNLILRNYDIENGRILIDGQDISKVTQDSLREEISIIPQDPTLFHRSLMDNIRYGKLDATDQEIIAASIKAHSHDFIMKMPEKYDALVGERGVKLSGGQRQRIAIARAILKNAPILILDEATSALDSVTENEIKEGLDVLMQNHTTLVIAHRLSTLSGMDRILVFKEGKIVEDGTHDELLEGGSHYATMWEMQAGGFLYEEEEWDDVEWEESDDEEGDYSSMENA